MSQMQKPPASPGLFGNRIYRLFFTVVSPFFASFFHSGNPRLNCGGFRHPIQIVLTREFPMAHVVRILLP